MTSQPGKQTIAIHILPNILKFWDIGVEIGQHDIEACHRVKNNWTIVKFSNRKDCLQILRVKKQLKDLNCTLFNFPDGTKIFLNESICPYYIELWNKCKAIKNKNKLHQFYTINGIIKVKLVEHSSVKTVTHISDLDELFPDINIDDLQYFFILLANAAFP